MFTDAPEFRLWIQRASDAEPPFRLRWQVMDGRGTLLLPRGGGTDAAPATSSGTQSQLSATDVIQTRFLVVSDRGGKRNQFALDGLAKAQLDALDDTGWHALGLDTSGASLVIPTKPTPPPPAQAPPSPQQRIQDLEASLAKAQSRVSELTRRVEELEAELRSAE